jgi:hypothetical protein
MAKGTPAAEQPDRHEGTLSVKRGEKISFPVPAKHPLARFQSLTPVRSAEDLAEFVPMWEKAAASRDQPPPTLDDLVVQLKKEKANVLHLAATELRIPRGAVVTLDNPLNALRFDEATIVGDLVSSGELVLTCDTLTVG